LFNQENSDYISRLEPMFWLAISLERFARYRLQEPVCCRSGRPRCQITFKFHFILRGCRWLASSLRSINSGRRLSLWCLRFVCHGNEARVKWN